MTVQGASLREQLEENYDQIVGQPEPAPTAPAAEPAAAAPATPEPKDTRTAEERARDEHGRFVKQDDKPAEKKAAPGAPSQQPEKAAAPVATAARLGIKRPDSWKKELWSIWDKLDAGEALSPEERKQFLEYIPEREGQYVKGVSAYKAEAEYAKQLNEALTPYNDMIRETGMRPPEFVSALAEAHRTLSSGDTQTKLRRFAKLIQDYAIPVHELLVQGEDGKVYFNQQYFQAQQEKPQSQFSERDLDKRVDAKLHQFMLGRLVQEFIEAKDGDGNPRHPHFEAVRTTMDGLLRSGLAKDLASAYDAALRLPQHRELFEQIEAKQKAAAEEKRIREAQEAALRAKQKAISPRSSSPTGSPVATNGKNLRGALEEAYDAHVAGRI